MAEASWPDPADGRVVSEWQYEQLAARFSDDGLDGTVFSGAPVVAGSGMQVLVQAGQRASVRGFAWESGASDVPLAIASNASGSTRTDWVVLRLDRSDWRVRAAIRQGSPGSGPPSLVQQPGPTGVYEIPLARVRVTSGASSIVGSDVTPWPLYIGTRIRPGGAGRNPHPQPGELSWTANALEQWDGLQWRTIWQDLAAQATLSPTTNWRTAGPCWVRRTQQGLVQINLNLIRQNVAWYGTDPSGSPLTRVPAAYRPQGYIAYGHTHVTPNNQARFRVEPDGWVYGDNPTNRVDPGRALRFTFVYVP